MSMSNAERQALYRERHFSGTRKTMVGRINAVVSLDTAVSLDMLSRCYGVTKREVLESVLANAARDAERAAGEKSSRLYNSKSGIKLDASLLRKG